MKRRIISMVLSLSIIVSLCVFQNVTTVYAAMSCDQITAKVENYLSIVGTGRYWNGNIRSNQSLLQSQADRGDYLSCTTTSPCSIPSGKSHLNANGCTSNVFTGVSGGTAQCWGFGDYIEYIIFGTTSRNFGSSPNRHYSVDSNFEFLPGDLIWSEKNSSSQHIRVVYKIVGDTVYCIEGNYDGRCRIGSKTYTKSDMRSYVNYSASSYVLTPPENYRTSISEPDNEKPTISNAYASNVSGSSFDINCDLNDNIGVTRVWLNVYGPSGSNGYEVSAGNGHFSHTIRTSEYGGSGSYSVHIYVFDAAGNSVSTALNNINAIPPDTKNPTIKNAYTSNVSSSSFEVHCDLNDNVGVTRVWLNIYGPNGSDGYGVSASNGHFSHTIKTAAYGGKGTYYVHIYAFDERNNETGYKLENILVYDSENLGNDFKAYITHNGRYVTKTADSNIVADWGNGDKTQIWHFYRYNDGSYTIANISDYSYMEMENSTASGGINIFAGQYKDSYEKQRFFIYNINGAYYIKPINTNFCLDMNADYNIDLWKEKADWEPFEFDIKQIDYASHLPINMGDNFKAYITHNKRYVTKTSDNNIIADYGNGSTTQIWHFYRYFDGSYTIANVSDYSYMEMENSSASGGINIFAGQYKDLYEKQRFFIYKINGDYYIKPIYTRMSLDMNADYNIDLWKEKTDWEPFKFDIKQIDYASHLPINMGDDFKAYITHNGRYVTKTADNNIVAERGNGDKTQIWHFYRYFDGSYTIANISDYSYMEMENSTASGGINIFAGQYKDLYEKQRFFIYKINGDYYIKPIYTRMSLDMNADYNIDLWKEKTDWEPFKFDISKPTTPILVNNVYLKDNLVTVRINSLEITNGIAIISAYNSLGAMECLKIVDIKNMYNITDINLPITTDTNMIKVMAMDDLNNLKPLCEARTITKNEWITQ